MSIFDYKFSVSYNPKADCFIIKMNGTNNILVTIATEFENIKSEITYLNEKDFIDYSSKYIIGSYTLDK
jgi:hypothetical protein